MKKLILASTICLLLTQASIAEVAIECFDKEDQGTEVSAHILVNLENKTLSLLSMNYYEFFEPIVYQETEAFTFRTHLENSLKRTNLAPSKIQIPEELLLSESPTDILMVDSGGPFEMSCKTKQKSNL